MKKGLSVLAILAVAIALSLPASARGCPLERLAVEDTNVETVMSWSNGPLGMLLAVPGLALATGLYLGNKAYNRQ